MKEQKKEELQVEVMEEYLRDARFGENLITEEDRIEHLKVMRKHWDKLCGFIDKEIDLEKKRQIIIMNEFVAEKGEDYPLGQYLNMLIELDRIRSLD